MLRTKCIWCGKTVRGGDDWAGRSGKCPNCDAEIIFPRISPPPTEPEPARYFKFIDPDSYWKNTGWAAVAVIAVAGVSGWIWSQLIVLFAYGFEPYSLGLRATVFGKLYGLTLNNGQAMGALWFMVFASGAIWTWYLLVRWANYLVARHYPKSQAIAAVVLMGVLAWIGLVYQAMPRLHPFPIRYGESSTRQALLLLLVVFIAAAGVVWHDMKSHSISQEELEVQPLETPE
jgi:hypothetical protein